MKYVSYGSNLHPLRLARRTPSARLLGTAEIPGMALRFHKRGNLDGSAKCNLVPRPRGVAHVAVYELDHREIPALDRVEGEGIGYERAALSVDGFGACFTYFASNTHIDDSLAPFCWYRELVLAGCQYHGFPDFYTEAVSVVETIRDPDDDRHAAHMELVEAVRNRDGTTEPAACGSRRVLL